MLTAYCLETLNKEMVCKTSVIQKVLFVVFAGKKEPKQVRAMTEIQKTIQVINDDNIF